MHTNRTFQCVLLSLVFALATLSPVQSATHPSSVPGVEVADGFDAEVVSQGLLAPFGMALDASDNIVLGSNCVMCSALRLSHDGAVIGASDAIIDPDGVAVDSLGRVFVAGDQSVTLMNSFVSGPDLILAGGFSNLNDIVIAGSGLFVYESNGEIWQVSSTGAVGSAPLATTAMGGGISLDPLTGGLLVTTGPPSDLVLALSLDGTVTEIASMPTNSNPADAEQATGGPFGDSIYVTLGALGEIVAVDRETGGSTLFARGLTSPMRLIFEAEGGVLVSDMNAGRIIRIFPVIPESVGVAIDIKPGDEPNCFNPNGRGVIPVAIFGSTDLDVGAIDFESLDLEGLKVKARRGSGRLMVHFEFVNSDTHLDAVVQFQDNGAWTGTGDTATLTGMLLDGTPIEASDSICIVPSAIADPPASRSGRGAGSRWSH